MNHRRAFLKQLASLGAVAAMPRLSGLDRILSETRTAPLLGPDWETLAGDYLLSPDVIYLNHGSIGTIPRPVHRAHQEYLSICETNPWLYMWGGAWEEPREMVRAKAARALDADAGEVAITHNTTEGFNVLAQGLPLGPGDEVLFSSLNHPGASICWHRRAPELGFDVRSFDFPIAEIPRLTLEEVLNIYDRAISRRTRVLVFPHIDNLVGLRHPMGPLARLAHERGVEFVAVDAAQSLGMVPVECHSSEVDFVAASPHKWVQAPKGLGLLYVRSAVRDDLKALWVTWGQERWKGTVRIFEDYGTRNVPELLALGDALDYQSALGERPKEDRYREIWTAWRDRIRNESHLSWHSPTTWELAGSLFAVERMGVESSSLFERLNQQHGFVFRPFSSHGLNTVRISPNVTASDSILNRFVEASRALG